jgi:phosphoserine phosphatase
MKLICFDCDSTLSAIEGVDELGRLRGPEVLAQTQAMTDDAMNGALPIEDVFGRRLELIRPSQSELSAIGRQYIEQVEPTARATLAVLREAGWTPAIVSGGFVPAVRPLADWLGIDWVEAVELFFGPDGAYSGYDFTFPTTRSGGKAEVIRRLRKEAAPVRLAMVGDGVSDLEAKSETDLFIGFGGFVVRPQVEQGADFFIRALAELPALLR